MHDRVVDRAAAYASPAQLAVRDWLLVALAFAAGSYDAICFLTFGKVFTGFQSGNIVFLGLGLAGTRPPAGPMPLSVVVSLAAFALGAALAVPILRRFDGNQEIEDKEIVHVWPRRVLIVLAVALLAQLAFLGVWLTTGAPTQEAILLMLALNAFGMGAQMNAVRSLHVPGVSTTAVTATFISVVSGTADWSLTAPAVRRLAGVVVSTLLGALVADVLLSDARGFAAVLPVLVIAVVVVIASTALRESARTSTADAIAHPVGPALSGQS